MALLASPKLALKRGALLTAANWQVVVLQWVADSVFTALLAVPVVGGAALVEAEARARMARLTGALDAAVQTMAADGALVERAAGGDGPSITALFAAVALDDRGDAGRIAALTVYGVDGAPLAWDGRPSTLPASRPFSPPCSSCCSAARCSWRS